MLPVRFNGRHHLKVGVDVLKVLEHLEANVPGPTLARKEDGEVLLLLHQLLQDLYSQAKYDMAFPKIVSRYWSFSHIYLSKGPDSDRRIHTWIFNLATYMRKNHRKNSKVQVLRLKGF